MFIRLELIVHWAFLLSSFLSPTYSGLWCYAMSFGWYVKVYWNLQIQADNHRISMCRHNHLVVAALDDDPLGAPARSVLLRLLYGGWSGLLHVRRRKSHKRRPFLSHFFRYMYAKVSKDKYQQVTGNARAAILSGRFIASVIAQLLVSFETMSLRDLNYLTLGGDF